MEQVLEPLKYECNKKSAATILNEYLTGNFSISSCDVTIFIHWFVSLPLAPLNRKCSNTYGQEVSNYLE